MKTIRLTLTLLLFAAALLKAQAAEPPKADAPFPIGRALPRAAFHGEAYRNDIIPHDTVYNFPQTNVITFAPGAHSNYHRHGGMDILVTGGVGLYREEGRKAQVLRKGDVVHIPAGVRHWHGAAPGHWFQQIVIYDDRWNRQADYHDADNTVSDSDYVHVETEEYPHPNRRPDISLFAPGDSLLSLPTFTGAVRLSETLSAHNASGAPAIHNVVFEDGVYNAWHSHAGGQILIVTDGICYHQIEGGKVEVLHPGDVAKCPAGVRHWHGAAPGTRMAHLATNTNPQTPGVKWYSFPKQAGRVE